MSEFKAKELLQYFDDMCLFLANHHWTKRDERAVAIREMIQKPRELPQKRALTVDEIISKYPMTVRILLVQLVEQIERLQKKKPEVTEEFILGKATEAYNLLYYKTFSPDDVTDFIRSLIEEVRK